MLTPCDIADRLEEMVLRRFPGEAVYRELCPEGFLRPSHFIELDSCGVEVNFGTQLILLRPVYNLTTFVTVDEYYHSHLKELHNRQFLLLGLLLPGFLKIGDRSPKVEQVFMESGYDFGAVRVRFRYTLDRRDFEEWEERQKLLTLHLREEIDTNG